MIQKTLNHVDWRSRFHRWVFSIQFLALFSIVYADPPLPLRLGAQLDFWICDAVVLREFG